MSWYVFIYEEKQVSIGKHSHSQVVQEPSTEEGLKQDPAERRSFRGQRLTEQTMGLLVIGSLIWYRM